MPPGVPAFCEAGGATHKYVLEVRGSGLSSKSWTALVEFHFVFVVTVGTETPTTVSRDCMSSMYNLTLAHLYSDVRLETGSKKTVKGWHEYVNTHSDV